MNSPALLLIVTALLLVGVLVPPVPHRQTTGRRQTPRRSLAKAAPRATAGRQYNAAAIVKDRKATQEGSHLPGPFNQQQVSLSGRPRGYFLLCHPRRGKVALFR